MSMMDKLIEKWDMMDPDAQKKWKIVGVLGVILVMAIVVQKMSKKDTTRFEKTKTESTMLLPESSKLDMENLHSEVYRLDQDTKQMKNKQELQDKAWADRFQKELSNAKQEGRLGNPSTDDELAKMKAELEDLKQQQALGTGNPVGTGSVRGGKQTGPNMGSTLPSPNIKTPVGVQQNGIDAPIPSYDPQLASQDGMYPMAPPTPVAAGPGLRITSGGSSSGEALGGSVVAGTDAATLGDAKQGTGSTAPAAKKKDEEAWVPAGSIIQGVLLSGLDAPTSSHAQKNPTPIVIRIKHEAILPNFFKVDIRECFVIASAYGSMSTERANIRTETLSCVRKDGGIIETALQGYGVGEDGKNGLRGRLVTKQGAILAKAMTAGFFSGLADAAKPTAVAAVNTSPGATTSYQSPEIADIMAAGLGEGAANAMNQVSKFYLDMAKEMFPVIEVDGGRSIEIVLVKGTGLKLRGKGDSKERRSNNRS